jgi:hypothetical protein
MDKSDIVVKITYRKRRVDLTMTGRRDVPKFAGILKVSSLRIDMLRSFSSPLLNIYTVNAG